jgi:regulatory protein
VEHSATQSREREAALRAAIAALRRRERTVAELHAWLCDRGTDEELAGEVVAELVEIGELDDERFAHAFAEDKRALSGWGAERIEAALVDRGLGRSLAERAASEPRDAQLERAAELLRRRDDDLMDEAARARALGYLTRRGYEYELAYDAIRRVEG